ncbi:hypothetical protein DWU98_10880 [Dyella monticola]|uniref:Transcriptional regulator n=1 Tax=Dyella monticola TaxID=1927958 RepID=A0A370WZX1_9GAMM|nr:hypothetical protein [Dyella monticola]RDS81714.1 hypothetical protein DWU98_10880 [Dyella monticola]
MNVCVNLEKSEIEGLESVAEGRASAVSAPVTSRLLDMGLIQPCDENGHGMKTLQLTPKGLSFIRSSDQ